MAKRDDLVKSYIGALDACTVVILAGPDGLTSVASLSRLAGETPFDALWFSKLHHAEIVLAQCPQGWCDLTPAVLRDEVVNAAAAIGASFRSTAEIEAAASVAVAGIVDRIEVMRQCGQLAKVNRDYKMYRQRQTALGLRSIPYQAHLDAFTRSLVVLAAQNSPC